MADLANTGGGNNPAGAKPPRPPAGIPNPPLAQAGGDPAGEPVGDTIAAGIYGPGSAPADVALKALGIAPGSPREERVRESMMKSAREFVNLIAPKGKKLSKDKLDAEVGKLSAAQLMAIADLGSGRAAALHRIAESPTYAKMRLPGVMENLGRRDAKGVADPHDMNLREDLGRITKRAGAKSGAKWFADMVGKNDSVLAKRLGKAAGNANDLSAHDVFSHYEKKANKVTGHVERQALPDLKAPQIFQQAVQKL